MPDRLKHRIVIADDSRFWREKIGPLLSGRGREVIAVDDGQAVIEICMDQTRPVELVVLDLVMPGIDGFAVARHLRGEEITRATPIVGITGVYRERDFPEGFRAQGFDMMLEKTASQDEFLFVFNKYLQAREREPEIRPAPRVPVHLPAELLSTGGHRWRGAVANLSITGAFVSTPAPPEANVDLMLAFPLPEGPTIRTPARTVWKNENRAHSPRRYSPGAGVAFRNIRPTHRAALESYLESQIARFEGPAGGPPRSAGSTVFRRPSPEKLSF
jgi:CheY-like chemotaxis protein